jgi:hypothetical protein
MLLAFVLCTLGSLVKAQEPSTDYDPFSEAARCPFACSPDRSEWAAFHDLSELKPCNKTVVLDLNVYYKVEGQDSLFASKQQ